MARAARCERSRSARSARYAGVGDKIVVDLSAAEDQALDLLAIERARIVDHRREAAAGHLVERAGGALGAQAAISAS